MPTLLLPVPSAHPPLSVPVPDTLASYPIGACPTPGACTPKPLTFCSDSGSGCSPMAASRGSPGSGPAPAPAQPGRCSGSSSRPSLAGSRAAAQLELELKVSDRGKRVKWQGWGQVMGGMLCSFLCATPLPSHSLPWTPSTLAAQCHKPLPLLHEPPWSRTGSGSVPGVEARAELSPAPGWHLNLR